jgi:hypothetical protein
VLARKLAGARVAALAGTLCGWAVVHSAHVSPYGQVPATIVPAAGAATPVHLLLLDDLAALDATEPNYRRERLEGLDLVADRVGRVDAAEAYVSRWGALEIGGAPVPLGSLSQQRLLTALGRGA